jgi:glycine/D-amino acid oxidase-like deaminating enzyme/nitrite reductase/ring-hydroxylating ferredoxin subunit
MSQKKQETISLWQSQQALKNFPSLNKEKSTDVCIIGAGIAGLSVAYNLSQNGKGVIVLDDGPVAGGQTVRTTGHLSNALDDRYFNLEGYFGIEGSKLAAQSHAAAIHFIEDLVKKHHITCHFEKLNAYLFLSPGDNIKILDKELQAAHRAGLEGVEKLDRAPFFSFDTGPALRFPEQAQFSPLPYLHKLCDLVTEAGSLIFTSTHATNIKKQGNKYLVTTQGPSIVAQHVVIATNSPICSPFLPHLKQSSYRTYVIAGNIPKGSVTPGLYYDTANPYHYIRLAPSNDQQDLLIVGGEDHRTAEKKDTESCFVGLEKWTKERFPFLGKTLYRWSGQVIEPIDGLAFIGRVKQGAEIYMVTGDSGNGLTHGTIAGLLLNDLILKQENPWEKLYNPHRKTLSAARNFIKENINTFCQYRDWLTGGEQKSAISLSRNSGAIIRKGFKKYAVYCDEQGKLHQMSSTCPHLKAKVRWNPTENCWECPAHGSRFSALGEVIQGPANSNLKSF